MSAVEVRRAVELAFRDFNANGVPSSGAHDPVKAEIRHALGELLEATLSSIGAGISRYETKALMDAVTNALDGTLAYVWGDSTPANRKVYQSDNGIWAEAAWYFDAVAGVVQPLVDAAEAARDEAIAVATPLSVVEKSLRDESFVLDSFAVANTTDWGIAAGFGGIAFVADGADLIGGNPDNSFSALRAYLQAGAGSTRIRSKLYQRPIAQADAMPGAAANDVILVELDQVLSDLGITAGGAMAEVEILFPPQTADAAYSYCFAFEAYDETDTRKVIGFGQGPEPDGKPDRYRGFYRDAPGGGGVWGLIAGVSGAPRAWLYSTYIDMRALAQEVDEHEIKLQKLDRSFETQLFTLGARDTDSFFPASDSHFRWGVGAVVGTDIAADKSMSAVLVPVELTSTITKVKLRVWQRDTGPTTEGEFMGDAVGDVELSTSIRTLAELGLTADDGFLQSMLFSFPEITTLAGKTYIFDWTFYNDANVTQGAGIAFNTNVAGLTTERRGFYDNGGLIGGTAAIGWAAGYEIYVSDGGGGSVADTRDFVGEVEGEATAYVVEVTGNYYRGGVMSGFADDVTLDAPTTGNVVDENITLSGEVPHKYFTTVGDLAHSNVSSVVVKDAGTDAVLVLNTDYRLEPTIGVLSRASAGADRPVKVSYHWSKRRYDLICIHAETRALVVVEGVERDTDVGEFLPVPSSSALVPLFNARVADGFPVELVPVWYLDGNVHRDLLATRAADFERQRRALAPLLAKARRGETIKVASMGDSILAQEDGFASGSLPNGVARDRPGYFLFNIGSDRVDDLPLYDQGDGGGAIHTRTSAGWAFCNALADLGATVEYYDFGIGGSGSGAGSRNGGDPVLRAGVWATTPDALFLHYGMNETGSDDTEANLLDIAEEAATEGVIAVIAAGMPRPSSIKPHTMANVRKTWRATRRAMEAFRIDGKVRGAYFDPARLVDDGYIGAMGLSTKELGSADAYHHPGIHECEVYGNEIHALVTGD